MPPSKGFLAFLTDYWYNNGKRMSIMPFLPRMMPPSRRVTLELRMVAKPHGSSWRDVHEFIKDNMMKPAKDDDDEMTVRNEDLHIRCVLGDDRLILEKIVASTILNMNKFTIYFALDFAGLPDDLPVMLSIKNGDDEMRIEFMTRFVHTTDDSVYDMKTPLSISDPKRSRSQSNFEDILKAVAQRIVTETDFFKLGRAIKYNIEDTRNYVNMKSKYDQTYYLAALQMLQDWRESTQRSQLKLVLQEAGLLDQVVGRLIESGSQRKPHLALQDDDMTAPAEEKGRQILLEGGRIVVSLPPGKSKDGRKVTVRTLLAERSGIELRENDAVIAVGLQFSPSGIQFDQGKTVKVTMPHCGIFTKPDEAKIVLYIRKEGFTRTVDVVSSSVDEYPRCVVRAKDLDLYIDHFCVYLITAAVDKLRKIFIGKRLKCTPQIPEPLEKDNKDCIDLYLRDDDGKEMDESQGMKFPSRQLTILWWKGPLTIRCSQDKKVLPPQTVEESQFYYKTEDCKTFVLELQGIQVPRVLMKFVLEQQSQPGSVDITFTLDLRATPTSARVSPVAISTGNPSTSQDAGTTPPQRTAQSRSGSTASTDQVTDEMLNKLCEHIPAKSYSKLSSKLGIAYNSATSIYRSSNDYAIAIRECLAIWKNRTGGSLSELSGILQAAELGNLKRLLPQDGFDDVHQRHPAPRHRDNQGRVAPRYNALSLTNLIIPILLAVIVYLWYKNSSK